MFFTDEKPFGFALQLTAQEYVRRQEDATARALLADLNSPFAEWDIRDGHPELQKVDTSRLREYLRRQAHSEEEVEAYVKLYADPKFNERNRRGFDRLRIRISHCRDISMRLLGPTHTDLESVPIGIAMIPFLNAGAHPIPGGGSAIMINVGLSFLFDYFNIKQLTSPDSTKPPSAEVVARMSRLSRAIFGDQVNNREFILAFPQSIAADVHTALRSRMKMAMCSLFILLHEYGHIALGHIDELRGWPSLKMLTDTQRHVYREKMRRWEYEADRFAYDILRGKSASAGTPVPEQRLLDMTIKEVFTIMHLAAGHNKNISDPDDSHPLPKGRLFRLFGVVSDREFLDREASSKDDGKNDGRFVDEFLIPLLQATSAIVG